MDNKQKTHCPDCQAIIALDPDSQKGEIITCPECDLELEIVRLDPFKVEKAPETQEDWE